MPNIYSLWWGGYPSKIKPTLNEEEHQWHALQVRCFWGEDFSSTLQRPKFQVIYLYFLKHSDDLSESILSLWERLSKRKLTASDGFPPKSVSLEFEIGHQQNFHDIYFRNYTPTRDAFVEFENIMIMFCICFVRFLTTKNMLVEMWIHSIHISYISTDLKITAVSWSVPVWNQESKMAITLGFF